MRRDRRTQLRQTERVGIAEQLLRQRLLRRRDHLGRGRRRGLAQLEMDHRIAAGRAGIRLAQHVHGDEGRHPATLRNFQDHAGPRAKREIAG